MKKTSENSHAARFLRGEIPSHLKRPVLKIQPILAREGNPSVNLGKLVEMIAGYAELKELVCVKSAEHWRETIEAIGSDVDAILPLSNPCYPSEIWNSCPEPLAKRGLPVIFWPLIEFNEPDFWKWSARDMLRTLGVEVHLVKSCEQGQWLLKALAMRRFFKGSRLLVFGEQNFPWNAYAVGMKMKESLGTEIVVKPLSAIRARYERFDDAAVNKLWTERKERFDAGTVKPEELTHAIRSYLAIKSILEDEKAIGFGVNCFGDLLVNGGRDVPCLAQCLAREDGYIASCDGDFCAMMNMALMSFFLDAPCMMSNMYPLSYSGAIKEHFGNPLAAPAKFSACQGRLARLAHCGFTGVVSPEMTPRGVCRLSDWGGTYEMKRDGRGCGIDGDLIPGAEFTGSELKFDGKTLIIAKGKVLEATRHKGMPHCEATALLELNGLDGFINNISREHMVLIYGNRIEELKILCDTLGLNALVCE